MKQWPQLAPSYRVMCRRLSVNRRLSQLARLVTDTVYWRRFTGATVPYDYQKAFLEWKGWDVGTRRSLALLPRRFITEYALSADTATWVQNWVRQARPSLLLECGSGISTVMTATALAETGNHAKFVSLESEETWYESTACALKRTGLRDVVDLRLAPLCAFPTKLGEFQVPDPRVVTETGFDWFFIDAPPAVTGRGGVLPAFHARLAPGAHVVLDDAARTAEREHAQTWCRVFGLHLIGYVAVGSGLVYMRLP